MKTETHNPHYKLVSTYKIIEGKSLNLVYGVSNEGENEGLEVYFLDDTGNFYRSYRYTPENLPKKYLNYFNSLKAYVKEVPSGHKMNVI